MLSFPKWLLAGFCGGAVGGAVWVAVSYFGGVEIGWLAWGIGGLAGLAVRLTAGDSEGAGPGFAAALAAVAVILGSKYLVAVLTVNQLAGMIDDLPDYANDRDAAISRWADEMLEARDPVGLGGDLDWPPGQSYETASRPEHYPPALAKEATESWDRFDPAARAKIIEGWERGADLGELRAKLFAAQFGLMDLLFFGLAAVTAWGLGSGAGGD